MFACMECGRKFKSVRAAEKAANDGCPGCGGVDVDIDVETRAAHAALVARNRAADPLRRGDDPITV